MPLAIDGGLPIDFEVLIPNILPGEPEFEFDIEIDAKLIILDRAEAEIDFDFDFIIKTCGGNGEPRPSRRIANSRIVSSAHEQIGPRSYLFSSGPVHIARINIRPDSGPEYNPPEKVERLLKIGHIYSRAFEESKDLRDASVAIACFQQGQQIIPTNDLLRPALLWGVGRVHLNGYFWIQQPSYLGAAISYLDEARGLASIDHTNICEILIDLASALMNRFQFTHSIDDIGNAIDYLAQVLSITDDLHPLRIKALTQIGTSLGTRYNRLGHANDINLAIKYLTHACNLASQDRPHKSELLSILGLYHTVRFETLGRPSTDVEEAIDLHTMSLSLTPDGHPEKPERLFQLSISHHMQFKLLNRLADLYTAINGYHRVVDLIPQGHPLRYRYLDGLAVSLMSLYESAPEEDAHLEEAIKLQSQAVSLLPDQHPEKVFLLSNLATSIKRRYDRYERLEDLNKVITIYMHATRLTSGKRLELFTYLRILNGGASASLARYHRLGELSDLDRALDQYKDALVCMPHGCIMIPTALVGLGNAYNTRYQLTRDAACLTTALEHLHRALSEIPQGHPLAPIIYHCLGTCYLALFKHNGEPWLITSAITCHFKAVDLLENDTPKMIVHLNGLSAAYGVAYSCSKEKYIIEQAIRSQSLAMNIAGSEHPMQSVTLLTLGELYYSRFRESGSSDDLDSSISSLKTAATHSAGPPSIRLRACSDWARYSRIRSPDLSIPAYAQAMALIPQVAWIGSTVEDRYHRILNNLKGINLEAASVAIQCGGYEIALKWLEAGKSIVWGQVLQLRTSLERVASLDKNLSEQLAQVSRELDNASHRVETYFNTSLLEPNSMEQLRQNHHNLTQRWEQVVLQARRLPGMDNFSLPYDAFQLLKAAHSSMVVCLVVRESESSALIVARGSSEITHLALPDLSTQRVNDAHSKLSNLLNQRGRGKRVPVWFKSQGSPAYKVDFIEILLMLWTDIAEPVLKHLGFRQRSPRGHLPRITWCTSGTLNFLPLHAAGDYTQPGCTLFEHTVSSYTPYLGALLVPPPSPSGFAGILAVGQASTPGFSALPGTVEELDRIHEKAEDARFTRLDGDNATQAAVLDGIEHHSWVHFACHASQNLTQPTLSAFHLNDGPLELASISRKPLPNAHFGFLSGCETGMGTQIVPDEAVHLAAGMIMTGFRTVVATMWSIEDSDAPVVAEKFYASMLRGSKPSGRAAARALHDAVAHLRASVGVENFIRWVPYVHIGV